MSHLHSTVPHRAPPIPEAVHGAEPHCTGRHALDRAYRDMVEGKVREDLLRTLCQGLAESLDVPLVAIVSRHEGGALELEASSRESALWAEWMRLPERWDGTVAGNGPAARALASHDAVVVPVTDDGFMPWREAARRDGLRELYACPLDTEERDWVLLAAFDSAGDAARHLGELRALTAGCARLIDAHERYRRDLLLASALRHAGNAAFIADVEGQIVWCNAALSALTGYPSAEVVGRNPRFLSSGRHGIRHYRELWSTIRNGDVWRGETVDRDSNGAAFTALQTISPFGRDGRVTHYLALYDDITRQKREDAQRALRSTQDPLTGLMHRAALEHQLADMLAQQHVVRVGRLVMRRLAALEPLGAETLESVLGEMQARVRSVVGADRAARIAVGEYLLQLPEEADQARLVIEALHGELAEPYPLVGALPGVELCIGQAVSPADGQDLDALLRAADRALGADPQRPARRHLAALPD